MKQKSRKTPLYSLFRLVDFLNWNVNKEPSLRSLFDAGWEDAAKEVLDEIRADVQRILEPPPIPPNTRVHAYATSPAEYWLRIVVDKIEAMDFLPGYHVTRWPDPLLRSARSILQLGRERFVVLHTPLPEGMRDQTYWQLGEALTSGEFSMLRRCLSCLTYFVTTRSNKTCCTRACSMTHQNKTRLARGYFKERRESKKEKTELEINARVQRGAVNLYRATIYGDLSKRNTVKYNQIQREVGGGDDAKGHREIGRWLNDQRSFNEIDDQNRAIFIKYATMEP